MKFPSAIAALAVAFAASSSVSAQQPMIFDSDHGPFIDDIFALGLLLQSRDLIDLQLILGTSEQPDLSALCVAAQLQESEVYDIPVAIGETLPPYEERGSVCGIPGILGFGIEPACREAFGNSTEDAELIEDGVAYAAQLMMDSGRDDWWYLVVGGQTSLRRLIEEFPEAASKIDTLLVMAGNWCADFEPYPNVTAPTDETVSTIEKGKTKKGVQSNRDTFYVILVVIVVSIHETHPFLVVSSLLHLLSFHPQNIGCDPQAANFNLDSRNIRFNNVYYVPVVVADEIGGEDYAIFTEAANSGEQPIATATLDFYKLWSEASRADPNLLVHAEALAYDPETESTPQFDAMAVMLALEMLAKDACEEGRIFRFEFDAVHFAENADEGLQPFPEAPRSAFSFHTGIIDTAVLPEQCPNITEFTFDPEETPELEYPIMAALGFVSPEAKDAVYADMARRLAGEITLCGVVSTETPSLAPSAAAGGGSMTLSFVVANAVGLVVMMGAAAVMTV